LRAKLPKSAITAKFYNDVAKLKTNSEAFAVAVVEN
jgi:hypothetical protein